MATDFEKNAEPNLIIEDETLKTAAKKGVSITISLVMLGFSGWKDLEPGSFIIKRNNNIFIVLEFTLSVV